MAVTDNIAFPLWCSSFTLRLLACSSCMKFYEKKRLKLGYTARGVAGLTLCILGHFIVLSSVDFFLN